MAKRNIMGVISGKLGNMVGQSNALVSGADKQVWRIYKGDVKNPKTIAQAHQRSLFVAAKNFQQAFSDILDHSWQGVDYGTKSLNHFRHMVLANGGSKFPNFFFQPKGAMNYIPQPWPISRGSLNINTTCDVVQDNIYCTFNKVMQSDYPSGNATIGDFWSIFLNRNPQFQDGDMITLLVMSCSNDKYNQNSIYVPYVDRFIINTKDTNLIDNNIVNSEKSLFGIYIPELVGGSFIIVPINTEIIPFFAGAGLIVSRQNGSTASWLRTKSDFFLTSDAPELFENFSSDEYTTACLKSFMDTTATAESNWYLNETGATTAGSITIVTPEAEITVISKQATLSDGTTANVAYIEGADLTGYLIYGDRSVYATLQGNTVLFSSHESTKALKNDMPTVSLTLSVKSTLDSLGYTIDTSNIAPDQDPEG